jgi:zinc transporter, ZIP family
MIHALPPSFFLALSVCVLAALCTVAGGLAVLINRPGNPRVLAWGLAFAAGAMIYVALVEILRKGEDLFKEHAHLSAMAGNALPSAWPYGAATVAFFLGLAALALLDRVLPNPHLKIKSRPRHNHQHLHSHLKCISLFTVLAITAHNVPEGMATFFTTLQDPTVGLGLSVAIAIHNIPEGISVALPIYYATGSRAAALLATLIAALAEPVGALLGYVVLAPFLSPFLFGSLFGLIAGAMVYLALDELWPTARRYAKGHETLYGLTTGMALVALSLMMFK